MGPNSGTHFNPLDIYYRVRFKGVSEEPHLCAYEAERHAKASWKISRTRGPKLIEANTLLELIQQKLEKFQRDWSLSEPLEPHYGPPETPLNTTRIMTTELIQGRLSI